MPAALALFCAMAAAAQLSAKNDIQPPPDPNPEAQFHWPEGKRAAVSLSFDDARLSQMDTGLALFQKEGVKVTFFAQPGGIEERLQGWKRAVADGHEIANHTTTHPCSGNYPFSRKNALEDYTLQEMAAQIDSTSEKIHELLGVEPRDFAYPCGQKFVGRGLDTRSYVPLIAERFLVGRGYLDESPNNPAFFDFARAMGTSFDDMDFAGMKKIVDEAAKNGTWVIFVGHEIGTRAFQTTDVNALEELCAYLKDPHNGIWLGTVDQIGSYVRQQREQTAQQRH
jgi:peptidoglycan/xylan/chitin deacetylase (PgdA/CDA1 family)